MVDNDGTTTITKIKIEEDVCPKCHKDDLEFGAALCDDAGVRYPVTCKCGYEGYEEYSLVFDLYTDMEGNEYY